MTSDVTAGPLKKLAITCTSADCDQDLHCFRSTRKMRADGLEGACRICNAQLIDWPRVHERQSHDIDHTFSQLRHELIRHHFWHVAFDTQAMNHALRKGRAALDAAAARRITTSVAGAEPARDGRQTSFTGNVVFYAQHATASCCRTCINYWHGIPKGRALTQDEEQYLTGLVVRYLKDRLPDLPNDPSYVPRRRSREGT